MIQRVVVLFTVLALGQVLTQSTMAQEDRKIDTPTVNAMAFAPNGKFLATASCWTDVVRIWNVETAERVRKLEGHTGRVCAVAWSPDGRTLASGADDAHIRLWDSRSFRQISHLAGHESGVVCLDFSPDGKMLAAGISNGSAMLWTIADRNLVATKWLKDHSSDVLFAPDGNMFATAHSETVRFWSRASMEQTGALPKQPRAVYGIAFSPDGTRLATVSVDMTLKVWALSPQRELFSINTGVPQYCVAYSPDGRFVAAQGKDNVVRLLRATTGEVVSTLEGHTSHLRSMEFSPDGTILATGGHDHLLILWDVAARIK